MDDLPKMPTVFEVPPYRDDPAQRITVSDMRRLVAQLSAPPSDNEMLRQFATAAMPVFAERGVSFDGIAERSFGLAQAMLAEFRLQTEGGEWVTR